MLGRTSGAAGISSAWTFFEPVGGWRTSRSAGGSEYPGAPRQSLWSGHVEHAAPCRPAGRGCHAPLARVLISEANHRTPVPGSTEDDLMAARERCEEQHGLQRGRGGILLHLGGGGRHSKRLAARRRRLRLLSPRARSAMMSRRTCSSPSAGVEGRGRDDHRQVHDKPASSAFPPPFPTPECGRHVVAGRCRHKAAIVATRVENSKDLHLRFSWGSLNIPSSNCTSLDDDRYDVVPLGGVGMAIPRAAPPKKGSDTAPRRG
jgi:hypothetical protein